MVLSVNLSRATPLPLTNTPDVREGATGTGESVVPVIHEESLAADADGTHVPGGLALAAAHRSGMDTVPGGEALDMRSDVAAVEAERDVVPVVAQRGAGRVVAHDVDAVSRLRQPPEVVDSPEPAVEFVHFGPVAKSEPRNAVR